MRCFGTMLSDLKNKAVVVTGSSSGIGYAIAEATVQAGGYVLLHGTREGALRKGAGRLGERARWVIADLDREESPKTIARACIEAFGRIDGLVNNAGVFPRSNIQTADVAHFDHVFRVNTRAPLMLCKEIIADCRRRRAPGSIVNIGSINAWCGIESLLVYSMSKGALMTMTRNLADAVATDGIRVNQINVGWTLTEGEERVQRELGASADWYRTVSKTAAPRGSLMLPEEVAQHVVFWLSEGSAPATGAVYEAEQYPVLGRLRV